MFDTALLISEFDRAATLLTSGKGVIVVCSIIVIWSLVAFIWFRIKVGPVVSNIRRAVRVVTEHEGEQAFAENFDSVNEKMMAIRGLRHAWSEFDEILIKDPNLEPLAIRNTRGSRDYFSQANVIGDQINMRFYSAMPNLLTGTGILGTFVGLVAGIWLASKGLGSDDIGEVKGALQSLLNGASLAFLTSIAGLFSSIVFSWREKHWVHRIDGVLRNLNDALESRIRRITSESLAVDQLDQSRQQTEILTQFTTDLAFQIADAFQDRMSTSVGPLLERIREAVEGLREDQGHKDEDALKEMLEKFATSLSGAAGQELSTLGDTLNNLNERLEGQISTLTERQREVDESSEKSVQNLAKMTRWSISQVNSGVGEALGLMTEKVNGVVGDMAVQLSHSVEEAANRLKTVSMQLDETIAEAKRGIESAGSVAERYQQVLRETEKALEQMNIATNSLSGLTAPIERASQGFQQGAERMESLAEQHRQSASEVSQSVARLSEMQTEIGELWSQHVARFEGVDNALSGTFTELTNGLEAYTGRVREFVGGLDKHTASIVSSLAGANQEMSEAVEELADALNRSLQ